MQSPLVEFTDLEVSFFTPAGEVKAVNGLNYALGRGDAIGIVGESGSGKSVSVNALMRLLVHPGKVVGGQMMFDGKDVSTLSEREMQSLRGKEMAMIFQDPMTSLNPVFTIGNQLTETIRRHLKVSAEEAKKIAIESLELVRIPEAEKRMHQYPHQCSGGMRQRIMIAMALSLKPKLLIADEPTTALDVTMQAQILALMRDLKDSIDSSIILITHDLAIISELCSRVIVMYAGRVVERANIDDIFSIPTHPYTQGLLRCIPAMNDEKKRLVPIEGSPIDLMQLPKGCPFAPRCEKCMRICLEHMPPEFEVGPDHTSRCWLSYDKSGGEKA